MDTDHAFSYDGGRVGAGERRHFKFGISETYLSEPIRLPITIINGDDPGPTVFLSAAVHGDELNGVEVVRHVSDELDHSELRGTLVCLHVVNVPGFNAQKRYLPIYDRDLNRAFPGREDGTSAERIARKIYQNFIRPCDFGIDFHTSTRGRTNMIHVRADMRHERVSRLAQAFASNVILSSSGPDGSLRRVATEAANTAAITVELGEANRFERPLVNEAIAGVRSVFAEFGLHPRRQVRWPGWRVTVPRDEKTWLRADEGGVVEMQVDGGELVRKDETICTITNPFDKKLSKLVAPFTGVMVGVLNNPVVYPGNPICHLVKVPDAVETILRARAAGQNPSRMGP